MIMFMQAAGVGLRNINLQGIPSAPGAPSPKLFTEIRVSARNWNSGDIFVVNDVPRGISAKVDQLMGRVVLKGKAPLKLYERVIAGVRYVGKDEGPQFDVWIVSGKRRWRTTAQALRRRRQKEEAISAMRIVAKHWDPERDRLELGDHPAGIESQIDQEKGIIVLTGAGSRAEYEQALRAFRYTGKLAGERTFGVEVARYGGWHPMGDLKVGL